MRTRIGLLLVACLALTACTAQPLERLPEGVEVAVLQNRSDYATRTLEISVTNGTGTVLGLDEATFSSARFAEPAGWSRGTELAAGSTVNLRVTLPRSVCDPTSDAGPTVTLVFTSGGEHGTGSVTPTDPLDRLATIAREDCLEQAVAEVAPIVAADELTWTAGAQAPAQLSLVATPNAAGGSLVIERVDRTVLLSVVVDGRPVESIPFDLRVSTPDVRAEARVDFIPSRCDPHAVAEDKRGTFFPVHVSVTGKDGGESAGLLYVPVSDAVRVAIYEYIADYCAY